MVRRLIVATLLILPFSSSLPANDAHLTDGTRLRVRLLQFISSETSEAVDDVRFEIAQDVKLSGVTVIPRGAPVEGTILNAVPYRFGGWWFNVKPGRLDFTVTGTHSVNGA